MTTRIRSQRLSGRTPRWREPTQQYRHQHQTNDQQQTDRNSEQQTDGCSPLMRAQTQRAQCTHRGETTDHHGPTYGRVHGLFTPFELRLSIPVHNVDARINTEPQDQWNHQDIGHVQADTQ